MAFPTLPYTYHSYTHCPDPANPADPPELEEAVLTLSLLYQVRHLV